MTRTTDAFRTLYDGNRERVHRMLARLVGLQDAEDLTQIVFAKAAKALPSFRGEAEASTWLHRIAANAASDWLHGRTAQEDKVTVPLPDRSGDILGAAEMDAQPSAEQLLAQESTRACIRAEIAKLPATLRTALMLSALGGLGDAEIAETLAISHSAAKVRLHRARQELRKIIEERCDFYRNELSCKPASADCCAPAEQPKVPA